MNADTTLIATLNRWCKSVSALVMIWVGLTSSASAEQILRVDIAKEEISSRYTSVAYDDCTIMQEKLVTVEFLCPGLNGWNVIRSSVDVRDFLKLRKGEVEIGSVPKPGLPFNNMGDTLEWRGRVIDGEWRPFALILRWFIDASLGAYDRPDVQVLYVFRLDPDHRLLCTAGYIEVVGNPDHNQDARNLADKTQNTISCPAGFDHIPPLTP